MKRYRWVNPRRIRPIGRSERPRTRYEAPETAQYRDQGVEEGAHAALEAARGPDARQVSHE